jgi:hypothetical protein
MSENKIERTHFFHADASAVGGFITRPFNDFVPSHSSASLPVVGGLVEKHHRGRKWKNTVSYSGASTTLSGKKQGDDGPWVTEVTAAIDDLNIREIITAKRIVAQLSVEHPHEGYTPKIYLTGSQFVDLRISGIPITPILNYDIFEDYEAAATGYPAKPWARQNSLQKHVERQYSEAKNGSEEVPDWVKHHFHWLEIGDRSNTKDSLVCSIVDGFEGVPKNFPGKAFAHSIYVRDFGRIFFGEVVVDGGTYSLSMIRVKLGSPVGGAVSAATVRSNGKTFP